MSTPTLASAGLALFGLGALALVHAIGPEAAPGTGFPAMPIVAASEPAAAGESPTLPADGFVGVVVSDEAVDIAARTAGRVLDVRVRLGDRVAPGSILATLDDGPLRDELAMAQAALRAARAAEDKARLELEEARERHARWRVTVETQAQVVSGEELARVRYQEKYAASLLEAARARLAEQQARVEQLERMLADTVLRAPFEGLVAARYVDPGATLAPGSAVVRLISAREPRVRFAMPEEHGLRVTPGMAIDVRLDGAGVARVLAGTVDKVAPEVDAASRMITAEARLTFPPGQPDQAGLSSAALAGRVARVHVRPQPVPAR